MTAVAETNNTATTARTDWWPNRLVWTRHGVYLTARTGPGVVIDMAEDRHPVEQVIPLPKTGERPPSGLACEGWVYSVEADRIEPGAQTQVRVRVLTPQGDLVEHTSTPETVHAFRANENDDPDTSVGVAVTQMYRRFEAWKARATDIAHEYANDNDLCSRFDDAMRDIGLPERTREVDVRVRCESTHYMTVNYGELGYSDSGDVEGMGRDSILPHLMTELAIPAEHIETVRKLVEEADIEVD